MSSFYFPFMDKKEYNKEYYLKNKQYFKNWKIKNPNYYQEYYQKNKEKLQNRFNKWKNEHKERYIEIKEKFRKKNLKKFCAYSYNQYHKQRDSKCSQCKATENLNFHHIDYEKNEGITLCKDCHNKIHQ